MRRITKIAIWFIIFVSTVLMAIFLFFTFFKKDTPNPDPIPQDVKINLNGHDLGEKGKTNNDKNNKKGANNTSQHFPQKNDTDIINFDNTEKTKTETDLKKSAKDIKKLKHDSDKKNKVAGLFQVFPKLNEYDFYEYIHISNGKPMFTDQFISEVVKKVITEMNITQGSIEWGFKRINRVILDIKFNWISQENIYSKTYEFKLSS